MKGKGTLCNTKPSDDNHVVDVIAIIELGTENQNDVISLLNILEDLIKNYNNGMSAFTLTVFINENLEFLMEPESNISIVIGTIITKVQTMIKNGNTMFWDMALENVAKVLKGENPNENPDYPDEPTYPNYDAAPFLGGSGLLCKMLPLNCFLYNELHIIYHILYMIYHFKPRNCIVL